MYSSSSELAAPSATVLPFVPVGAGLWGKLGPGLFGMPCQFSSRKVDVPLTRPAAERVVKLPDACRMRLPELLRLWRLVSGCATSPDTLP